MLTTFDKVEQEIKGSEAFRGVLTVQQVMGYIRTVTNRVKQYDYSFEPYYLVNRITPDRYNINSSEGVLMLNAPLLEVLSITVGGVTATYGTDILPWPNTTQSPIKYLRIANPSSGPIHSWYPLCSGPADYLESIIITGFWGFKQQYRKRGFFDSGLDCPILTDSQMSFQVDGVDGIDAYGRIPLLSPGNLIRINDELMDVTRIVLGDDDDPDTVYVMREAGDSVAVTHGLGTSIYIWEPQEEILNMATRQAALLYARRGAYQQITLADGTTVSYPPDLLAEVYATIRQFDYMGEG